MRQIYKKTDLSIKPEITYGNRGIYRRISNAKHHKLLGEEELELASAQAEMEEARKAKSRQERSLKEKNKRKAAVKGKKRPHASDQ